MSCLSDMLAPKRDQVSHNQDSPKWIYIYIELGEH